MAELFASLPRQQYAYVDKRFLSGGERAGLEPCMWFGLTSVPGRAWGLTVLLESGAVYSHLPPHALYFPVPGADHSDQPWTLQQAQRWSCHGYAFAVHEYDALAGLPVYVFVSGERLRGRYLFTVQHFGDGYSMTPEQAKAYHWIVLDNGRLAAAPNNDLLVHDPAFTTVGERPDWIRRQTAVYTCDAFPNDGSQSSDLKGSTK